MRKVTSQMIQALKAGRSRSMGNTTVTVVENGVLGSYATVRLHGNLIAELTPRTVRVTLAGWNTPTTRDRVNAVLGEFGRGWLRINQRDFCAWLKDGDASREIGSREWLSFPRRGVITKAA
jgi:hypothetical protein